MKVGKKFSFREFLWDKGNIDKNWIKHRVSNKESEEVFFDEEKVIYKDVFHSQKEKRFIILGKTQRQRLLYAVFSERNGKIRIISVRDINRKERSIYEKTT